MKVKMVKKQSKTDDFRKTVADAFIASIEADPISWRKEWSYTGTARPYNAVKGNVYRGLNVFWLSFVADELGFTDPRWATFNQASDKGWKIKAGSKGTKIEYWMPFDNEQKKTVTWDEYNRLTDSGRKTLLYEDEHGHKLMKYSVRSRLFTVFNGDQIEGIPALEKKFENCDIQKSEVVDRVAAGMGVEIIEKEQNRAYYSPSTDKITLPLKKQFESDNAYQSTALHELGHATGHPKRLSRDQSGIFGSESYAYEELVAEISSTFMGEYFETEPSAEELENHKAYVQNWAEEIRKDKNYLFKAIKQAEEAADYMIEAGDLEVLRKETVESRRVNIDAEKALDAHEALHGADGALAIGSCEEKKEAVKKIKDYEEELDV